jgi:ATP-dependent protease HslVU (ClpYQ) peptidase subunit
MTTLLGLKLQDGTVYLAADRQVESGTNVRSMARSKIVRAGAWSIAIGGPSIAHAIISAAPLAEIEEPLALVTAIRERMIAWNWKTDDTEGPGCYGINLLLARPGELWTVSQDFGFIPVEPGFVAYGGSGGEFAAGAAQSLLETRRGEWSILAILQQAIKIASRYDTDTGGEPEVVTIPSRAYRVIPIVELDGMPSGSGALINTATGQGVAIGSSSSPVSPFSLTPTAGKRWSLP